MELTTEQCEVIRDFVENDLEDCSINERYSGRHMYGKNCFGISLSRYVSIGKAMLGLAAELAAKGMADLIPDLSDCLSQDSLGLGSIVYFTRIQWPENDEIELDEDMDEEDDNDSDDSDSEKE